MTPPRSRRRPLPVLAAVALLGFAGLSSGAFAAAPADAATATAAAAAAGDTNAPSRTDFSAYRLIAERNIFNPNRSARSGDRPPRETRRAPRVESFALVGTMSYPKGSFAFFDGSSSDFRKSLAPGGTIAGYTIREIKPTGVKLEGNGRTLELPITGELRREEEGEWALAAPGERSSRGGGSSSSSGTGSSGSSSGSGGGGRRELGSREGRGSRAGDSSSSSSAGDGGTEAASAGSAGGASEADVNEVLKRLMEQREKELK